MRRELDFKKCHYCYDRSISMTELTLVFCTCNLQFRPGFCGNYPGLYNKLHQNFASSCMSRYPTKKEKKKRRSYCKLKHQKRLTIFIIYYNGIG